MPDVANDGAAAAVFHAVEAAFARLPKSGKPQPSEWTMVAAFLVSRGCDSDAVTPIPASDASYQVVSIGAGTKCIGRWQLRPAGVLVHDCHAEILAQRGLKRYLLEEMQQHATLCSAKTGAHPPCAFGILSHDAGLSEFCLRDGVRLHLYISDSPCGEAQLFEDGAAVDAADSVSLRGAFAQPAGSARAAEVDSARPSCSARACSDSGSVPLPSLKPPTSAPQEAGVRQTGAKSAREVSAAAAATTAAPVTATCMKDPGAAESGLVIGESVRPSHGSVSPSCAAAVATADGDGCLTAPASTLRIKSGRRDIAPARLTHSMCCSDKVARWMGVGVAGGLASRLLRSPLHLSSVTISAEQAAWLRVLARSEAAARGSEVQRASSPASACDTASAAPAGGAAMRPVTRSGTGAGALTAAPTAEFAVLEPVGPADGSAFPRAAEASPLLPQLRALHRALIGRALPSISAAQSAARAGTRDAASASAAGSASGGIDNAMVVEPPLLPVLSVTDHTFSCCRAAVAARTAAADLLAAAASPVGSTEAPPAKRPRVDPVGAGSPAQLCGGASSAVCDTSAAAPCVASRSGEAESMTAVSWVRGAGKPPKQLCGGTGSKAAVLPAGSALCAWRHWAAPTSAGGKPGSVTAATARSSTGGHVAGGSLVLPPAFRSEALSGSTGLPSGVAPKVAEEAIVALTAAAPGAQTLAATRMSSAVPDSAPVASAATPQSPATSVAGGAVAPRPSRAFHGSPCSRLQLGRLYATVCAALQRCPVCRHCLGAGTHSCAAADTTHAGATGSAELGCSYQACKGKLLAIPEKPAASGHAEVTRTVASAPHSAPCGECTASASASVSPYSDACRAFLAADPVFQRDWLHLPPGLADFDVLAPGVLP